MKTLFILFAVLISARASALQLDYMGDFNLAHGTAFQTTTLGGLSGLTRDPISGKYLAISDDKSLINPARFYQLDVSLSPEGKPQLTPVGVSFLNTEAGTEFAPGSIDPEGIVATSDGRLIVSSEGNGSAEPRLAPALFVLDRNGRVTGALEIPEKFVPTPTGELLIGVLTNEAFEGLSLSPDESTLFVMTEGPLAQDDTDADMTKGSINRGLVYKRQTDGTYKLAREFAYFVEPAKHYGDGVTPLGGGNAISEILALNDHELILLERGGLELPNQGWRSFERLYKVDLSNATDVSSLPSLKDQSVTLATKELLVDLDDVTAFFSDGFKTLDNLEGLAFGPLAADGSRTLLVISDDNFSATQRTQLLAFKIRE